VATEVAEDASLEDRLHLADVLGGQLEGLVELDPAAAVLAEDAVEDDEVGVRVDVERRAEAMKEADGSELVVVETGHRVQRTVGPGRPQPGRAGGTRSRTSHSDMDRIRGGVVPGIRYSGPAPRQKP
jgi:hypothetical protein